MDSHSASRTSRSPSGAYQRAHADAHGGTLDDSPAGARGDGESPRSPREQQQTHARHCRPFSEATSATRTSGTLLLSHSFFSDARRELLCGALCLWFLLCSYDLRRLYSLHLENGVRFCNRIVQKLRAESVIVSWQTSGRCSPERVWKTSLSAASLQLPLTGALQKLVHDSVYETFSWFLGFRNTAHNNSMSTFSFGTCRWNLVFAIAVLIGFSQNLSWNVLSMAAGVCFSFSVLIFVLLFHIWSILRTINKINFCRSKPWLRICSQNFQISRAPIIVIHQNYVFKLRLFYTNHSIDGHE